MLRRHPLLTGLLLTVLALGGTAWWASGVLGQPITCNILRFLGAAAGSAPAVVASGCGTNIDINLVPKGTGVVTITGVPVVVGGVTIGSAVTGGTSPRVLFIKPGPVIGEDSRFTYDPVGFTASIIPNTTFGAAITATTVTLGTQATPELTVTLGKVALNITAALAWSTDLFLTRLAAATLQLGAADAAAPVAQALTVQSVVAGTTDTAGAAWLLGGSRGTGTGVGGDVGIRVAYPATTGNTQNGLATVINVVAANASTNALQNLVSLTPIVNQSGTASYSAFDVNLTRTAVGSGLGQLATLRVGGVQRWGFTDGATGVGTQLRATQATAPTCSANCGTTVPAVVGTDFSMVATMGSGGVPATPFTVTLNGTYTTAPSCQAVAKVTTAAFVTKVAPTATTVVVTTAANPAVNDSYNIVCTPVA
jgi:hypothetical protein